MESIKFTKMHGLGNSYIYINAFEEALPDERLPQLAIRLSNKNTGIGSDGMILIGPSDHAPVKMRIFNSDGSEAKNCGNGLRCVAKYAYEHKLVSEKTFYIETKSGFVHATVFPENEIVHNVQINMGKPRLERSSLPYLTGDGTTALINEPIEANGAHYPFTGVSMGNPHIVTFVDDIEAAPLTIVGPLLEKDRRFPEGVNVEFVEIVNDREMHFRVWERGSGVTQACGTGACAAVVAAVLNEKAKRGEEVTVHLAGGDLRIEWTTEGDVLMTGAAETICEGIYFT